MSDDAQSLKEAFGPELYEVWTKFEAAFQPLERIPVTLSIWQLSLIGAALQLSSTIAQVDMMTNPADQYYHRIKVTLDRTYNDLFDQISVPLTKAIEDGILSLRVIGARTPESDERKYKVRFERLGIEAVWATMLRLKNPASQTPGPITEGLEKACKEMMNQIRTLTQVRENE